MNLIYYLLGIVLLSLLGFIWWKIKVIHKKAGWTGVWVLSALVAFPTYFNFHHLAKLEGDAYPQLYTFEAIFFYFAGAAFFVALLLILLPKKKTL